MDLTSNDLKDHIPFIIAHLSQTDQWNLSRTCKYMRDKCYEFRKSDAFCKHADFGRCVESWHVLCISKPESLSWHMFTLIVDRICTKQPRRMTPAAIHKAIEHNMWKIDPHCDRDALRIMSVTAFQYAVIDLVKYVTEISKLSDIQLIQNRLSVVASSITSEQQDRLETIKYVLSFISANRDNGISLGLYLFQSVRFRPFTEIELFIDFIIKCGVEINHDSLTDIACANKNGAVIELLMQRGATMCALHNCSIHVCSTYTTYISQKGISS